MHAILKWDAGPVGQAGLWQYLSNTRSFNEHITKLIRWHIYVMLDQANRTFGGIRWQPPGVQDIPFEQRLRMAAEFAQTRTSVRQPDHGTNFYTGQFVLESLAYEGKTE